eukprot:m.55776 g.55776  ORF g.55776 m.55776 type:complete len:56 (+) comp11986_c1_seq1:3224-3391(+)
MKFLSELQHPWIVHRTSHCRDNRQQWLHLTKFLNCPFSLAFLSGSYFLKFFSTFR